MDPWTNIEITPNDPEIDQIDGFEVTLGKIPPDIHHIRKLIFGFEVCHFKYKQHIIYIKESIINLKPTIRAEDIGKKHIRHGDNVWESEKSGKSLLGQIYISALKKWLGEFEQRGTLNKNEEVFQKITKWLGQRESEKERLVRLLISRLKWDWMSYEKLLKEDSNKELESQVCRMDICHYNFPNIIDSVLRSIGKLKPVDSFEGCGSFTSNIKTTTESELSRIIDSIKSIISTREPNKSLLIKAWLFACFAKVLKEQVRSKYSLLGLLE